MINILLDVSIAEALAGVDDRAIRCLSRQGIVTMGDLLSCSRDDLQRLPGISAKRGRRIEEAVGLVGMSLKQPKKRTSQRVSLPREMAETLRARLALLPPGRYDIVPVEGEEYVFRLVPAARNEAAGYVPSWERKDEDE